MLYRDANFTKVRRLLIDGCAPSNYNGLLDRPDQWYRPQMSASERWDDHTIDYENDLRRFRADDKPAEAAYKSDDAWQSLAQLIQQLPGLVDLVYNYPDQFPPLSAPNFA